MKRIGILAVQGAFIEHAEILGRLGVQTFEIRQLQDIKDSFDGLVLPGGESSVQSKLLHDLSLFEPIKDIIKSGMPVLGTCAGLILLAQKLSNDSRCHFGTMPITVKRNAYGRQLGSFYTEEQMKYIGKIPMTFIRAPIIESVDSDVEILAKVKNPHTGEEQIVAVKYNHQLGISFHPELNQNVGIHKYFLESL